MGVFLCDSRHGIHVSCRVLMQYFRWVCRALQLLQLCDQPMPQTAVPYSMAPYYECTPTHGFVFESLFIYGA